MFGGQGQNDAELMNDLWLIRPNHAKNKAVIDAQSLKYKIEDPELTITVQKISEYSG